MPCFDIEVIETSYQRVTYRIHADDYSYARQNFWHGDVINRDDPESEETVDTVDEVEDCDCDICSNEDEDPQHNPPGWEDLV